MLIHLLPNKRVENYIYTRKHKEQKQTFIQSVLFFPTKVLSQLAKCGCDNVVNVVWKFGFSHLDVRVWRPTDVKVSTIWTVLGR